MKVVIVEPNKSAQIAEIDNSLEAMQKVVNGPIEPFYLYDNKGVAIICNEEGKIHDPVILNRAMFKEAGNNTSPIIDVIAGTFFVCKLGEEDFESLTDEDAEYWEDVFKPIHQFVQLEDGTIAVNVIEP